MNWIKLNEVSILHGCVLFTIYYNYHQIEICIFLLIKKTMNLWRKRILCLLQDCVGNTLFVYMLYIFFFSLCNSKTLQLKWSLHFF